MTDGYRPIAFMLLCSVALQLLTVALYMDVSGDTREALRLLRRGEKADCRLDGVRGTTP